MTDFLHGFDGFDPEVEGLREALTSTGNGYICTRGAAEWESAGHVHYPGTYVHGGYNRETTILGGLPVPNEDLVNLPNWTVLQLRIEGEDAIRLADVELLDYRHELDLRTATMMRDLRFRDRSGRVTRLRSRRFMSMADQHSAGIQWMLVPEDWSGHVEVVSAIDGRVRNAGVARYRELEGRHLNPASARVFPGNIIALKVQTRQSNLYVSQAARTHILRDGEEISTDSTLDQTEDYIQHRLAFEVERGIPTQVEKHMTFFTSRDPAVSDTLTKSARIASACPGFTEAHQVHAAAWEELWKVSDIEVSGDPEVQRLLRLHISHALQVGSRHTIDLDAGLPARGLNGEAYRGHVFWDEVFAFPFYDLRLPHVTRGMLIYRFRRLEAARAGAAAEGYRGAMFPWQSGSEGTEETQQIHLNPLSGRWDPDLSHNQRHVNAAIFYSIWEYIEATRDLDFLEDYGAEMLLSIARFWASIAHYNPERERYEIHGVMGPDEFHEKYPGAITGGLRNNAYTNVMVAWLMGIAGRVLTLITPGRAEALRQQLEIDDDELATWEAMSHRMFVPFHDGGIISQFEGYEDLEELDWDDYRQRYGNIQRLDRILRAEGKDPNRYKAGKQADVVMLFYLFRWDTLAEIFERLGYPYEPGTAARNIAYYDQRTSHGSTLSFVAHAGALSKIDPESSWERFLVALYSDAEDVQGGTTQEGIHMGVMCGTLNLMQSAYAGAHVRDRTLHFDPRLPRQLDRIAFPMLVRRTPVKVVLDREKLVVSTHPESSRPQLRVAVGDDVRVLLPGDEAVFTLS